MKRNEDSFRPSREEPEGGSFGDLATGLADVTITRSRAIKLGGAAVVGFAFAAFLAEDADARRRRRKRRKKRPPVQSSPSTVNFGDVNVGTTSPEAPVTVTNNGTTPVTLTPTVVGEGFTLVDDAPITIAPGETATVPVVFAPTVGGVSTGELRLVDANGTTVAVTDLLGNGVDVGVGLLG